uniref:Inosine/uridine-preferring nucleoside hydrolase domain-containing protein n=1 Tax=Sander lucioperca TaxID=283035 RepID=A0A8C9ZMB0_SANLU
MKKKLILDDTGVDDAQAIMVALVAPDAEILGITCCHGNTLLENVLKNTLRVLKVCNRLGIPVYRGRSGPLLDPDAPGLELLLKKRAAEAIIKIVNITHYHETVYHVSLVATAPLTNLAVAVQLNPTFPKKLKALYNMGENTECKGNTTACGEFNFVADPEAVYIVLDHYSCPTYIATWEFSCRSSLPWVSNYFKLNSRCDSRLGS